MAVPKRRRLKSTKSPGKQTKCEKNTKRSGLSLLTDEYGEETYWELYDVSAGGVELDSVDDYTYDSYTQYEADFGCLEEDNCYEFVMYDDHGDGIESCGGYSINFGKTEIPSPSGGKFGKKECILFGNSCGIFGDSSSCTRRALEESKSFYYTTKVEADDRTVRLKLSVEMEQTLQVVILDQDSDQLVEKLWDGVVTPGKPVVLSFDAKNIHIPMYKASIISEETGNSKTFTLGKKMASQW